MKFLDEAKIYISSGQGGSGCMSFRREKYIEYGGPNGGNGGRGGSIIFKAVKDLNTLIDFRYQQHYKAKHGKPGMGDNKTGESADDMIIKVPVGTVILDEDEEIEMADLSEEGQEVLMLKGGDGGFGNAHYKSSTNQAPRKTTSGWLGQEMTVRLRLKLIADVGLVGLPNAGKSTFLATVSNAKPKIADYPFTTLHPNLGVVKAGERDFVIADIPGLIEGAHEGVGLGTRFLGHVERTSVLLHLIDCTHENIIEEYRTIRTELKEYGVGIEHKKEIVVLNKVDALGPDLAGDLANDFEQEIGMRPTLISGVSGEGVKEILYYLGEEVHRIKNAPEEPEDEGIFAP